ncbi:MAG: GNAT family N-acetyltransferase [Frankiaceae bacterium]|nr:GNAT family N-acetyltransferase [Frankiaceae bacterium]
MGTPQIRAVRPEDYAAVAELTARVYLDEGYGSPEYEPRLRDVAGRDAAAHVLVAVLDGRVVGAVTLAPYGSDWAEAAEPAEAVIRMLAVHPDVRGAGTGEALVRACVDVARADRCTRIRLSTEPTMTVAHRLYERIGFVRTPSDDWEPVPGVTLLGYRLDLQM